MLGCYNSVITVLYQCYNRFIRIYNQPTNQIYRKQRHAESIISGQGVNGSATGDYSRSKPSVEKREDEDDGLLEPQRATLHRPSTARSFSR